MHHFCHEMVYCGNWATGLLQKSMSSFSRIYPPIACHYCDVIMRALASQVTGVAIAQLFVQSQTKENAKAPRHWPLWGNSPVTGELFAQKASNAENVSIWWRHHDLGHSVSFAYSLIDSLYHTHYPTRYWCSHFQFHSVTHDLTHDDLTQA